MLFTYKFAYLYCRLFDFFFLFLMIRRPPRYTLFPYTTLFRSFLTTLPKGEPIYFMGLGSNLLVRDGGFHGTVVLMHSTHGAMRVEGDLIYAEASVACPKVARLAATRGFEGAEFLSGVPGTVGGALAMNAGCYGSETWDVVAKVLTISRAGTASH